MDDTAQEAIKAALSGDWSGAIELNLSILKDRPDNVDSLNRLAKAYFETGQLPKAQKMAQEVLKIDPLNSIASRALEKWKLNKNMKADGTKIISVNPQAFLEEPGKTKITNLTHVGDGKVVAKLDPGEELVISCHGHTVSVLNDAGELVGKTPDDVSLLLRNQLKDGNKCQAYVRSISKDNVHILLRSEIDVFPKERIIEETSSQA